MLASSTFLASAASTRDLQFHLLLNCHPTQDPHVDSAIMLWTASHNIPLLDNTSTIKQHASDAPVIAADKASLWSSLTDSHNTARLLAVSSPYSGDWLHALPVASCGTRLDNEAIWVAVRQSPGVNLCEPHMCPCNTFVDAKGSHGLSCKRSMGRSIHNHQLNDLIWRALMRASIPSVKEPAGLSHSDVKRPDGLSFIPWQGGKCLTWDVTVADMLAVIYLVSASM